ncbi:hypothetical protein [Streptomyces sp. NPDC017524]|uniref:hypothetical protein n=1 Tax=unclassified Streptomyces TaxID=2593676 RepID=UPI0037AEC23E
MPGDGTASTFPPRRSRCPPWGVRRSRRPRRAGVGGRPPCFGGKAPEVKGPNDVVSDPKDAETLEMTADVVVRMTISHLILPSGEPHLNAARLATAALRPMS